LFIAGVHTPEGIYSGKRSLRNSPTEILAQAFRTTKNGGRSIPVVRRESLRKQMWQKGHDVTNKTGAFRLLVPKGFVQGGENGVHKTIIKDYMDCQYFVPVSIGDETKKDFLVIPDTGSSNLWVPSDECEDSGCTQHTQYRGSALSSSPKNTEYKTGKSFAIQYGSGQCAGSIAVSTVDFAGFSVEKTAFGLAEQEPGTTFISAAFDGILGMAFNSISVWNREEFAKDVHSKTIFEGIVESEQFPKDKQQFSFYLGSEGKDGELTLGDVNEDLIEGTKDDIHWVDLSSETYWQFHVDSMSVDGHKAEHLEMIADTGTSLIAGPSLFVSNLNQICFGEPNPEMVDCKLKSTAPDVTLNIRGKDFVLTAQEYIMQWDTEGKQCMSAFTPMDIGNQQLWILGDVFLRKYHTTFHFGNKQLGFVKAI